MRMEDLSKYPGLCRRKNNYEIRKRVPKDLVDAIGKKEITKALGTDSFTEAVARYHVEMNKLSTLFDAERAKLKSKAETPDMLSAYSDYQLKRLAVAWLDEYQKKRSKYNPDKTYKGFKTGETITDQELVGELKSDINDLKDEIGGDTSDNDIHMGATKASKYLEDKDVTFDSASNNFKTLAHYFSKALLEYNQRLLQKTNNKPYQAFDPMFTSQGQISYEIKEENEGKFKKTIKEVINEHFNNPSKPKSMKTRVNYAVAIRILDETFGLDSYIHKITRSDVKEIQAMMMVMPANLGKIAKGVSLKEGVELGKKHNWRTIEVGTANANIDKINAILNHAEREEYLFKNPAKQLRIKDKIAKKHKKHPFSSDQLNKIFYAPIYTGCKDDHYGYNKVGTEKPRNSRFWMPLVALWTGMRLGEIIQLGYEDIVFKQGVPLIHIYASEDGDDVKRVKTENGIRYVPIHQELQKIGFLDYVELMRKKKSSRLFPDVSIPKNDPNISHNESSKFSRFLIAIDAKTKKTSFHSFRHSFRDALREAKTPLEVARQLGGWADDTTDGIYGHGHDEKTLYDDLCVIKYDGLDLSHLYLENAKDGQQENYTE